VHGRNCTCSAFAHKDFFTVAHVLIRTFLHASYEHMVYCNNQLAIYYKENEERRSKEKITKEKKQLYSWSHQDHFRIFIYVRTQMSFYMLGLLPPQEGARN
jgi:hypothetical protein